ncbi:uncharacterized protein C16orf78 homolog isoform X2 [Felis catus]|uniref:uncharacterized protein C16orf78 homolog isoform X2 n=1 Tax=Felis catus TaxID=9685 RepID=UPI001D199460|nr:uncharacterized protein C16orf78 homolog isoform X2 [Felis catus]
MFWLDSKTRRPSCGFRLEAMAGKSQPHRNPTGRYPLKQLGRKKRKAEASPKSRKGTTRQPSLRRVEEATPSPVSRGVTCLPLPSKTPEQGTKKDKDHVMYQKLKGKRLSLVPGSYSRDNPKKSELDIKDAIVLESTQRSVPYHRQSIIDPMLQDPLFSTRRSTLLRDWVVGRMPEVSYERKLKSLMEKGAEPKVETVRMLKPEEVLSCRYLRLSKNNIRTLLKLCKDAGMNVDIHPHMVEGEIDAKKFSGMQMKNTRQYHQHHQNG